MQNHQNEGRSSVGFIAGVITAILVTGGGATWWAYHSLITSETPNVISSPEEVKNPDSPQNIPLEQKAEIYWLSGQGEGVELVPVPVMLQKSVDSNQVLKTALNTLLAGPSNETVTTSIPSETRLLDFKTTKEGIHINLSQAFTEGGGSASMQGRLKQILYTATSINPNQPVWLKIEGQPLEVLGGEGLMIAQPMTRQWFEQEYRQEE